MNREIRAIFLDVGNTLRIVVPDAPFQAKARQELAALVAAHQPIDLFYQTLDAQWKAYRRWAIENLIEASEKELWTRFMLPGFAADKVEAASSTLTRLWRDKEGRRVSREDARPTIVELHRRGYDLGIIANTIAETEIQDWLAEEGLTSYFKTVVLSSQVHCRKPGAEIFGEASRRIGIPPARCAYVGDNPQRDVTGTRQAGFAMAILLIDPSDPEQTPITEESRPDAIIRELSELLDIFPQR